MDAANAQTAAEAAEGRVFNTLDDSTILDFLSKTTLSRAMGVSSGIATEAHRDLAEIQRDINVIEGHRKTAKAAYDNLNGEAKSLEEEALKLQQQVDDARKAEFNRNTEAEMLEHEAAKLRADLDIDETLIAGKEAGAAKDDEAAKAAAAEAAELERMNPTDPRIAFEREKAERHRMHAAEQRAEADAIRRSDRYIEVKRDIESAEAAATAKRSEAMDKGMEVKDLQEKAKDTVTKATKTTEEAGKAKEHLDMIEVIKDELDASRAAWQGAIGDSATAAESEKAKLVLDLLALITQPVGVFLPTDAIADLDTADYVFARADKPAGEGVSYVDYGMWLEGPDDALQLHRRVDLVGPQVPTSSLTFFTEGIPPDLSATYTGKARGLSARTVGTVTASGHFEADVKLVATFGYQVFQPSFGLVLPTLDGTIDNFRPVAGQGSGHVDTGWSIRLQPAAIDPRNGVVNYPAYVRSSGSPTNPTGSWNATAYGDTSNERPDGFYGGFNTMFCDGNCNAGRTNVVGSAAGVYSAEKP